MASLVNPSNINGNFPIAGQDNDSQGFRDNFTNIRNNFTFIKSEVEDLQAKAVLKSALTGTTLNNDFQGQKIRNLQVSNFTETLYDWGLFAGGDLQLDLSQGNVNKIRATPSTDITINPVIKNWPSSLQYVRILLYVTIPDTSVTITLPTTFASDLSGIPGLRRTEGVPIIHYTDPGDYIYELSSPDSGTTVFMRELTTSSPVFRDPNFYTLGIGVGTEDDSRDGYQSPTLILGFGDYLGAGTLNATTGVSFLIDDLKDGNDTLLVKGSISAYQRQADDTANAASGIDSLTSGGFSVIKDRSTLATEHGAVTLGAIQTGDLVGYYNGIGLTYTDSGAATLGYQQLGTIEFVANGTTASPYGIGGGIVIKTKGDGTLDNTVLGLTGTDRGTYRSAVIIDALQNVTAMRDVTVTGNLTVQGQTTTINTETIVVEDKNIFLGNGASAATNNGAGITIDGASATLLYTNATDSWNFNKQVIGQFTSTNLQVTGGSVTGITGAATTLVATNFSSGNAVVTGGSLTGITGAATTFTATNFSSGNAVVTGGSVTGITGAATTLVATNFSSGNAVVTGGSLTGITGAATTLVATNFSSGNIQVTGGSVTGITGAATTFTATNFSSGNILAANAATGTNSTQVATTAFVQSNGGFLTQVVFSTATAGTTTWTIPAGTTKVKATVIGGGGGGGGVTAVAGAAAAGGGGGAMGVYYFSGLTPGATITYGVGNGGIAGTTSGAAGGAGGVSNVSVGGVTISASGGTGGAGATAGSVTTLPGTGGGVATQSGGTASAFVGLNGGSGMFGIGAAASTAAAGGAGAAGFLGAGAGRGAVNVTGAGTAGGAYGAGGGGALGATASAGGAGAAGAVIFEY